jgi:putative ABC transport system substrate-binding protein
MGRYRFASCREQIVALASYLSVPAIYEFREFATTGGQISYGTSLMAVCRPIGIYAGRILKGAKPADLRVVEPPRSSWSSISRPPRHWA